VRQGYSLWFEGRTEVLSGIPLVMLWLPAGTYQQRYCQRNTSSHIMYYSIHSWPAAPTQAVILPTQQQPCSQASGETAWERG